MEQIKQIHHIGLRVRNYERSVAFYKKLGFEVVSGPTGPEPVAAMKHPAGVFINFVLNTSEDASEKNLLMDISVKHTGYTHMAFEITDKAEVERQLMTAGVKVTETVTRPNGAVFFFARDPDGNVVEFHRPAASAA